MRRKKVNVAGTYRFLDGLIQFAFMARLSMMTYIPVKLLYSTACYGCHHGHDCSFLRSLIYVGIKTVYQFCNCFILSVVSDKPIFPLKQ